MSPAIMWQHTPCSLWFLSVSPSSGNLLAREYLDRWLVFHPDLLHVPLLSGGAVVVHVSLPLCFPFISSKGLQ